MRIAQENKRQIRITDERFGGIRLIIDCTSELAANTQETSLQQQEEINHWINYYQFFSSNLTQTNTQTNKQTLLNIIKKTEASRHCNNGLYKGCTIYRSIFIYKRIFFSIS